MFLFIYDNSMTILMHSRNYSDKTPTMNIIGFFLVFVLSFSVIAASPVIRSAYAQTATLLTVKTDHVYYRAGDDITVSGTLTTNGSPTQPIMIQVKGPHYIDVIDQFNAAPDGSYSYKFRA